MIHKLFLRFQLACLSLRQYLAGLSGLSIWMPHQLLVMAQLELCLPLQPFPKAAPTPAGSYHQGRCGTISCHLLTEWLVLSPNSTCFPRPFLPITNQLFTSSVAVRITLPAGLPLLSFSPEGKHTHYPHLWRPFRLTQIHVCRYVNCSHLIPWPVSFL